MRKEEPSLNYESVNYELRIQSQKVIRIDEGKPKEFIRHFHRN